MSNITDWFSYPYNYSNGTAVDGVGRLIQYANVTLDNSLGLVAQPLEFKIQKLQLIVHEKVTICAQ